MLPSRPRTAPAPPPHRRRAAFTLIELMIAVCIIGVLASVGLPAYAGYVMSARSSEVPTNMSTIYKGMLAYWERPFSLQQGTGATSAGHCRIQDGGYNGGPLPPLPPGPEKRTADWSVGEGYGTVGFAPAGAVYGCYAWGHPPANDPGPGWGCGLKESDFTSPIVHAIYGITDLDGDGIAGGYSLQVGIRGEELFRQPGFGSLNDALTALYGPGACPFCSGGFVE